MLRASGIEEDNTKVEDIQRYNNSATLISNWPSVGNSSLLPVHSMLKCRSFMKRNSWSDQQTNASK